MEADSMIYSPLIVAFDKSKKDISNLVVGYQQGDKFYLVNELTGAEAEIMYYSLMGYVTLNVKELKETDDGK